MTTIAASGDGIVAADSQQNVGDFRVQNPTPKLIKTKQAIYAITGTTLYLKALIAWHEAGANPDEHPEVLEKDTYNFMVFTPATCLVYHSGCPYPDEYNYPVAFGTGGDYAYAAMAMGAGSIRAVEVACQLDTKSGLPVKSFPIKKPSVVRAPRDAKQVSQPDDADHHETKNEGAS